MRNRGIISPSKFSRKLKVEESSVQGHKILTISSRRSAGRHVIFLHGGAYIAEAIKGHRYIIEKLARSFAFKVSFIDYPLAPESHASKTLSVVKKACESIFHSNPQDSFFLLGDSAGGGLALALLQILEETRGTSGPLKAALVSPWLDISMSNPEIDKYRHADVLLDVEGLKACGMLYAGELDVRDPFVSPLYGKLEDLPEIKLWVSDCELFYPDCVLLNSKLKASRGSASSMAVKEEMVHDWIVMPIRERNETLSEIAEFFNLN